MVTRGINHAVSSVMMGSHPFQRINWNYSVLGGRILVRFSFLLVTPLEGFPLTSCPGDTPCLQEAQPSPRPIQNSSGSGCRMERDMEAVIAHSENARCLAAMPVWSHPLPHVHLKLCRHWLHAAPRHRGSAPGGSKALSIFRVITDRHPASTVSGAPLVVCQADS